MVYQVTEIHDVDIKRFVTVVTQQCNLRAETMTVVLCSFSIPQSDLLVEELYTPVTQQVILNIDNERKDGRRAPLLTPGLSQ
ncbi:hypothetical protein RRG08_019837 [Elysia crispata]|uniref:Uncharacterized protein n=1 Tax=Elysia crispata TaxID=231223 RepID=A0AAE0ZW31_9GAST|nr:hypothetical protein RRG08_019837 [Elysia crispata]